MLAREIFFLPARELGARIRRRELTSEALAEGYLERLASRGAELNAVVTLLREPALVAARAADRDIRAGRVRGPLHGVPYGVKDLLATRDAPTTWGAEPYRNQTFATDATVVARLQAAGAVLVAKLAMVELAGGLGYDEADASFTGPGLNPWSREHWSGGSSSGPAAAVAAGLVGFAIGSETSGSILTPAAFSGATGLRPTYGRVSRAGAMALCWTLDKLGPICRTADDCGLVLAAVAGADPADPSAVKRTFAWQSPPAAAGRKLRLAVPRGSTEQVQPAVRDNFEASLAGLERFVTLERDVEWPDFPWRQAASTIITAEGAAAFLPLLESGGADTLRCEADRIGGYAGLATSAVDYIQALRLRVPMQRAMNDLFRRFDVVATPTRATVAYPVTGKFKDAYPDASGGPPLIPAGNLCGLPAVCLPNGSGLAGLPTSFALLGPAFSEARLLGLAARYQRGTRWHERQPPQS